MKPILILGLPTLLCAAAAAGDFTLTPAASLSSYLASSTAMNGTLIGDWDAEANPEGTQTRLGVWGGSGNNPIPLDLSIGVTSILDSVPEGFFELTIDSKMQTATMTGLQCNILGEELATASIGATMAFETFRSIAPDSLYLGVPIDLPLSDATMTSATLTQISPGVGTAIAVDGQDNEHQIVITIAAQIDLLLASESFGEIPVQLPLPILIEGIHQVEDGQTLFAAIVTADVDEVIDLPAEPLPTLPLELPTVLPPGELAGVLLNLTPTTTTGLLTITGQLEAIADNALPGDVNGDGVVGTDDLLAILSAWGNCGSCPEDLTNDGLVGVDDVLLVVSEWT